MSTTDRARSPAMKALIHYGQGDEEDVPVFSYRQAIREVAEAHDDLYAALENLLLGCHSEDDEPREEVTAAFKALEKSRGES